MTAFKKLKFLFIQPDFPRHYVTFFPVYEPFHGLLFGAIVKDIAQIRIFDRRFDTDRNLIKEIESFEPDIIGSSTHVAGETFNVKRLFSLAKSVRPDVLTIVGGQHSTLLPEDLFDAAVDLICIGPGEETFRQVAEERLSNGKNADYTKIAGLAVRNDKEYYFTLPRYPSSLYRFSWPPFDRSLIPQQHLRQYFNYFERRTTVYTITSMGCPFRCKFCSLWAAARGTYRRRNPEEIVNDIIGQPQPFVHITDDNTFHDETHALEIARLLQKHGVRKKILAYARTDTIVGKPHVLEEWRKVGLGALVVGMEAVSNSRLDYINKKTNVDINIQAQKVLDRLGIENWAHFVLTPDFEKNDFDELWEFVDKLNITYPVFVPLTPVPGTPLFFEVKKAGQLSVFDYGFYNLQYMVMKTKIPKAQWYRYARGLYLKTCDPRTLFKRSRKAAVFNLRPALGRAFVMGRCVIKLGRMVKEQLELERTIRYEEIEHTLPPSLRKDYTPANYYNSPTLLEMKERTGETKLD